MSYKGINSNQISKRGKSLASNQTTRKFDNRGELDVFRNDSISLLSEFNTLSKNMFKHFEERIGFPSMSNMMQPFGLMRGGFDIGKLHSNMDEFEDSK